MKHVWEGKMKLGTEEHPVRVRVDGDGALHTEAIFGIGRLWEGACGWHQEIQREALRRLLARAAHADTVAKAASHTLTEQHPDTPTGLAEHALAATQALKRLIRAVIDGPEPTGDSAHVELKAYLPAEDVARRLIAARGWPSRDRAAAWLANIINGVRDERSTFPHPLPGPVRNALHGTEHYTAEELLDMAEGMAAADPLESREEKTENALIVAICGLRAYELLRGEPPAIVDGKATRDIAKDEAISVPIEELANIQRNTAARRMVGVDKASGPDTTAVLIGITDAAYEDAVRKIGLLAYGDREKLTANQIRSMADELADLLRGLALSLPKDGATSLVEHPAKTMAREAIAAEVPKKRTCNRHDDCDAADAKAKARGREFADHCHDECCEECFGN